MDDGFAQTFQEDNLFDDVIPVEETMQTRPPEDLFGEEFTPAAEPLVERIQPESQENKSAPKNSQLVDSRGHTPRGHTLMKNFVSCSHEANNLVPLDEPRSQRARFSRLPRACMVLEIALAARHP